MKMRTLLLTGIAGSLALTPAAEAARRQTKTSTAETNKALLDEVRALRSEVETLRAKVDSQGTQQASTQAQADATKAQVDQVQTQLAAAPAVTPADVDTSIAGAIYKEHHSDKIYFKGITITPGGYLELAGIYRDHFQGNDISSNFNNVNFPNAHQYYQHEGRFTARQSRLSFLAEGAINPAVKLAMYGEFDFQGAAQTADSNQSDSYNPRIRTLYGTIDWNRGSYGLHLLAGQNWSLVTMQAKGISPRSEVTPPQIDAQYIPGFAWARQPGIRIAADFMDHHLWLAAAVENPQTAQSNSVNPFSVSCSTTATNGLAGAATCTTGAASTTAVSATTGGRGFDALNNNSFSDVPDVIGKAAYEADIGTRHVHVEGFGIVRTFNERILTGVGSPMNHSVTTVGYGGSINLQVVPKLLDVQFSGMGGKGIGRYGSAGLTEIVYSADGRLHPTEEMMLLGGATLHATKALDLYGFAGEEQIFRTPSAPAFGLATVNSAGCFIEGGSCSQIARRIRQLTFGFWDKFYQGSYGRAQVGIQYSHTERELFYSNDIAGFAQAKNDMAFLSFRYYPF